MIGAGLLRLGGLALASRRGDAADRQRCGFTLVELLIVVGIISILASIAVPNLLEAQTRAKVARVRADFQSLATAIEVFRLDVGRYPPGTDFYLWYPPSIHQAMGSLTPGFSTFATGWRTCSGKVVGEAGIDFLALTSPIAYIGSIPVDPFAVQHGGNIPYSYMSTETLGVPPVSRRGTHWILTSPGPDADLLAPLGRGNNDKTNPLSTGAQQTLHTEVCPNGVEGDPVASIADINESEVMYFQMNHPIHGTREFLPCFKEYMLRLSYDPTNGTVSDGDLWRTHEHNGPRNW